MQTVADTDERYGTYQTLAVMDSRGDTTIENTRSTQDEDRGAGYVKMKPSRNT